jgi:hypothetical protein
VWLLFGDYETVLKLIVVIVAQLNIRRAFAGCRWLTPVILSTWEAEIGRMAVRGQPRQKSLQDPISTEKKAGLGGVHLSYQRQQEA